MADPYGVGPNQGQAGLPPQQLDPAAGGAPQQPYPPGAQPGAPYPPAPSAPKMSALAVVALVMSLLFFIPLLPLVGAILGIVATVRISRRRNELAGFGLAVAAIPTGFVIFLFTIGIYAAIAIPAFVKYTRKAKTVEAIESLDKLKHGARAYFQADRYDDTGKLRPNSFPLGQTGWVPATPCCAGGKRRCSPTQAAWSVEPWRSLRFSLSDPHYYQYRYQGTGSGPQARYIIEARGDLDCDGVYSTFKIDGRVDEEMSVVTRGPIVINETE